MDYWLEDEDIMYDDGDQSEGGRGPKWLGSADTLKHGERIVNHLNEQAAQVAALKAEVERLREFHDLIENHLPSIHRLYATKADEIVAMNGKLKAEGDTH